jgi:replication initiation and membrane attachment protein
MKYLSTHDFYSIRRQSLISDADRRLIVELYQPLIGLRGCALYLTLDAFLGLFVENDPWLVETLTNHMQITIADLSVAKAALEAVGLMKTYSKNHPDYQEHVFELYAPKSPAAFFDDVILRGLLEQYVGAAMVQRLRLQYQAPRDLEGYEEDSASFGEVFHPDFNNPLYAKSPKEALLGHRSGNPESQFDRRSFTDEVLKKSTLKPNVLTDEVLREVDRIANLYGIDELAMAEIFLTAVVTNGHTIVDFDKVREMAALETKFAFAKTRRRSLTKVTSATSKAQKIRLMEETDPKTYLRYRNHNTAPTPADLKLINDIQENYRLPFPVINALLDFILEIAELTLPRALVEKVASSLARAQVTSAIDAMEYLLRTTRKKKTPKTEALTETKTETAPPDEIDIEALIASYEKEKAGSK